MIRILSALVASVFAFLAVSCGCCTSDVKPPGLRKLPQFREITAPAPAPEVIYAK